MSQQKPNRTSDDTYKRRLFYDNGIRFVEVNGRMTGEYNPPTPILKVAANVNIQSSSSFINKISIHPMLRFNWEKILGIYPKARFQYILCYGSTGRRFLGFIQRQDFNTSYVTVQLGEDSWDLSKGKISIHPMLRFNLRCRCLYPLPYLISIHPMLRFNNICMFLRFKVSSISIHPMLRFNIITTFF